jgi:RES domain
VWRVGFAADPLAFTPSEHCSWTHRFDDPERRYRTLYCAEDRITCLRETLATFRPDAKAVTEYRRLFGKLPDAVGSVPRGWLERHALAPGRIEIREGELASVDDPTLRRQFERQHADLLVAHGMQHLDISEVRSRDRIVTRTLSRFVFERGAAGILYRSNLDDLPCVALFERRAALTADGEAEALADLPDELLRVSEEFGLACSVGP